MGSTIEGPPLVLVIQLGAVMQPAPRHHCGLLAEIKKIIYWDLDKRLRIVAGIGLWPSATGDAPVQHQNPTDEVISSASLGLA